MKRTRSLLLKFTAGLLAVSCLAGCQGTPPAGSSLASPEPASSPAGPVSDPWGDAAFTSQDLDATIGSAVAVTLADGASAAQGEGVLVEGDTLTFTLPGAYRLTGALTDGQLRVEAGEGTVRLVLAGASVASAGGPALVGGSAVILTLAPDTVNSLTAAQTTEAAVSGADLTLNGSGSLTVESPGHGIQSKGDLKITGGALTVTAGKDALHTKNSFRLGGGAVTLSAGSDGVEVTQGDCLLAGGDLTVTAGGGALAGGPDAETGKGVAAAGSITLRAGSLTLDAADDGLHAGGDVFVTGGTLTVATGDDGLHADNAITVTDGALTVQGHEGLEGETVTVSGGDLTLTAGDDGVNASGETETALTISGGRWHVSSRGDCLDANGGILLAGGELTLYSAGGGGEDGLLDSKGPLRVTGGTVLGAAAPGLHPAFAADSLQPSLLVSLEGESPAGTEVSLTNDAGEILARFIPEEPFSVVLLSLPALTPGAACTLTVGGQSRQVTC